jgi:hypothetical protein
MVQKVLFVSLNYGLVLLLGPAILADVRVEVVVPALSALLSDAPRQLLGDVAPVFGAVLLDQP